MSAAQLLDRQRQEVRVGLDASTLGNPGGDLVARQVTFFKHLEYACGRWIEQVYLVPGRVVHENLLVEPVPQKAGANAGERPHGNALEKK